MHFMIIVRSHWVCITKCRSHPYRAMHGHLPWIIFTVHICMHACIWNYFFWITWFPNDLIHNSPPLFEKYFKISKKSNPVIPNNGVMGIDPCKINWALVGTQHQINFHQNKSDWNECHVCCWWFFICLVTHELYFVFINCALTPFLDSAWWFLGKVCIYSRLGHSLCMF